MTAVTEDTMQGNNVPVPAAVSGSLPGKCGLLPKHLSPLSKRRCGLTSLVFYSQEQSIKGHINNDDDDIALITASTTASEKVVLCDIHVG